MGRSPRLRLRGIGLTSISALLLALLIAPATLCAQYQPPSQWMNLAGSAVSTWTTGGSNIIQIDGPVLIEVERAKLSAKSAVVWLEDAHNGQVGEQAVIVALIGDAKLEQAGITRSGEELLVTVHVNGPIKISAQTKSLTDESNSPTFQHAQILRLAAESAAQQIEVGATTQPTTLPATQPTTGPTTRRIPPVHYQADHVETTSVEGNIAWVLSGHVAISTEQKNHEIIEMQADRAVLFSKVGSLRTLGGLNGVRAPEDAIGSAYLEGDVRIDIMPALADKAEQRLEAERVYYDFDTDRAVLTDAIIHTIDQQRGIPIIVRAKQVKQLSQGEYRVEKAQLTTSSFAVPSYSIRAEKAYILEEPTTDPRFGGKTSFVANNATFNLYGLPVFYLPTAAGSFTEHGMPLRGFQVGDSTTYGTYIKTEWGLFESLGQLPPQDVDVSIRADYFSDRGVAGGLDGKYGGGFISETSKQPYTFEGDFKAYIVPNDPGFDVLGRKRADVDPPDSLRGRVLWEHQNFFPDDWQLQVRTGWVSDANFREAWFEDEFNDGLPLETSLYLKKQHDSEAITFLTTIQPNNLVTTSDLQQENFEIERVPQLGYHRIGDSFDKDQLTFFSDNTAERVKFNTSTANSADEGFKVKRGVYPGQPSRGILGVSGLNGPPIVDDSYTDRGDFRQEVDYPFSLGRIKVVPYVVGRYTGYSDTPDGGRDDRGFFGTGVRFNTQIWSINNNVDSDFWDLHRVRHIIEPELHLWTSTSNVDPNNLWIYDDSVDPLYDVSAMQIALRQRWETKRGAPGNYRNVEFFSFNVAANFYSNQPPAPDLAPVGFRGLFFPTTPELSIPRNSINADSTWRMSDTTILLSDAQYNLDEQVLATASIGLIAERGERTKYFLGLRYIDALNSEIVTLAATYQLTAKYSFGTRLAYDFGSSSDVYSSVSLQRKFDRFFTVVSVYNDSSTGESGFSFGLYPEGLGAGASTDALSKAFGNATQ